MKRLLVLTSSLTLALFCLPGCSSSPDDDDDDFHSSLNPNLLDGVICVPTGNGLFDAYLEVKDAKGTVVAERTTDFEGRFEIEELADGSYTIEVTRGHYNRTFTVEDYSGKIGMSLGDRCFTSTDGSRVVVEGGSDTVGSVIGGLGFGYQTVGIESTKPALNYLAHLLFPNRLANYDTIFFNSGMDQGWMADQEEIGVNLQDFVADGGSVYASDDAYWIIEQIDPGAIDFEGEDLNYQEALVGVGRFLEAEVFSPQLDENWPEGEAVLLLNEDFAMMETVRNDVTVLVQSNVAQGSSIEEDIRPLAVRWVPFPGGGTVTYTSFHNHPEIDSQGWHILFEMVTGL